MSDDKSVWNPVVDGRLHATLGPSDLEYLERLVQLGEGLLLKGLQFCQAEALLSTGHAVVADRYGDDFQIRRIVPTEAGITLARIREEAKVACRINVFIPPPKEKT